MFKALIMDETAMQRVITRISFEIVEKNKGIKDLHIAGIKRRGVALAYQIADKISEIEGEKVTAGVIDISNFRDDRVRGNSAISDTHLPFEVTDKKIVIVDDVLHTGRTVRAAIDAIMEVGRPRNIQLAVLIDRGHRELPIRPDFVGKNVPTSENEKVRVMVTEFDGENKVIIEE